MDGKEDRERKKGKLTQNEKTDRHLKNRGIGRHNLRRPSERWLERHKDTHTGKKTDRHQKEGHMGRQIDRIIRM
jgi:hypothetical protein